MATEGGRPGRPTLPCLDSGVTWGGGLWRSAGVTMDGDFLKPLRELPGVQVEFIERVPGVPVDGERDEVLELLRPHHVTRVREVFGAGGWWQAEQVHGAEVAVVESPAGEAGATAWSVVRVLSPARMVAGHGPVGPCPRPGAVGAAVLPGPPDLVVRDLASHLGVDPISVLPRQTAAPGQNRPSEG